MSSDVNVLITPKFNNMRGGNKSITISNELEKMIKSGHLASGSKLPSEYDMALQYQVSPGTIRKALQGLARKGLVERTRKKGTFINERKLSTPITILLPCPNYLCMQIFSAYNLRQIFDGALEEAAQNGIRIETISVSSNNNPEFIDWRLLDHLNSESKVIIVGVWYYKIFSFLAERHCQVAFCHNMTHPEWLKEIEDYNWWGQFIHDIRNDAQISFDWLRVKKGCKSIALAGIETTEPEHPILKLYKQNSNSSENLIFKNLDEFENFYCYNSDAADGLFIGSGAGRFEKLARHLLKSSKKLHVFFRCKTNLNSEYPQAYTISYDFREIGSNMVSWLLKKDSTNKYFYHPQILCSEEIHKLRMAEKNSSILLAVQEG